MRVWLIRISTLCIFFVLSALWLGAAAKKPLWNDELYSQTSSVRGQSYLDMLTGHIPEGNITPLFYFLQKILQDLTKYQTPQAWVNGHWDVQDPYSNVFLRILPVLCMAGGVCIIFYYFSRRFNVWTGIYALMVSLTSFMVWSYAFEARPYALWFLLTALQMIAALSLIDAPPADRKRLMVYLIIINMLLGFTVVFSVIQNVAVCALTWSLRIRQWRFYLLALVLPAVVSFGYYLLCPKYQFWLAESFMKLLGASLPIDRMAIIGVGFLVWLWMAFTQAARLERWGAAMLFSAIIFMGCWLILLKFKMAATPSHEGFQVSNRYFMVLAPVGIIMTTMASYYLAVVPTGVLRYISWGMLLGLLGYRILKILPIAT